MISVKDFEDCEPKALLLSQYNKDHTINIRVFYVIDLEHDELSYLLEIRDDNGQVDRDLTYERFEGVVRAVNYWSNEYDPKINIKY